MTNSVPFECQARSATTHGSSSYPAQESDNILCTLPHYNLLSFLAITERLSNVRLYAFTPSYQHNGGLTIRAGASGIVHDQALSSERGIIFKRYRTTPHSSRRDVFKAIISEVMVLKHPVLARHPNIVDLDGITWDVEVERGQPPQITPVLVLKRAEHGNLADFFRTSQGQSSSLKRRLQMCIDVALALDAMHTYEIVHGDIKPDNVLVCKGKSGEPQATVTDFGYSCFGCKEEDRVHLGYTAFWHAPEWRNRAFTIKEAKLMDVYSFGKICKWILLAHTEPPDDFAACPQSNYNGALEALHGIRGIANHSIPVENMDMFKETIKKFFALSLTDSTQRASGIQVLLNYLRHAAEYLQAHNARRTARASFSKWTLTEKAKSISGHPRPTYYIRAQIERFFAFCILGRKSKFFAPGQIHAISYKNKVPSLFFLLCMTIGAFLPPASLIVFCITLRKFLRSDSATHAGLGVLLGLFVLSFGICSYALRVVGNAWREVRAPAQAFLLFGGTAHPMPTITKQFSLLNVLHYLLRVQIVEELEKKATGDCAVCQQPAALLLAFCYEAAFGTSRNIDASSKWLSMSERPRMHLSNLLKEANAYDDANFPGSGDLVKEGHVRHGSTYLVGLGYQLSQHGLVNLAVEMLRNEIKGKQEVGIAARSQRQLFKCLASVYMTVGAYQDAEDAIKQAGIVWQLRGRRLRPFYHDSTKLHLAAILNVQGRGDEAAKVLEAFPFLLRNPNGKEPFWLLKRFPRNRNPDARRTLARVLLQNDSLDVVLKLDLESDARDALKIYAGDQYSVTAMLQLLAELGSALLAKDRVNDATKIYRQRHKLWVEISGSRTRDACSARLDLAFALSHGINKEVDEAITLLDSVLDIQGHLRDFDSSATHYNRAYNLTRKGLTTSAIQEIRMVLTKWTESESLAELGWMGKLGGSLCLENESNLRLPVWMQTELLNQCDRESNSSIQLAMISLMWALYRGGDLEKTTMLTRSLLDLQTRFASNDLMAISMTRTYLIILLAHNGLAFEDEALLDDALRESDTMLQVIEQNPIFGVEDRARAASIMASVYAKKVYLLYIRSGFGESDKPILNKAIAVHRWALELCETAFGWDTAQTLSVATALAFNLSKHSLKMGFEEQVLEAEELFSRVAESISRIEGVGSIPDRRTRARYNRMLHEHGKISDESAQKAEEDFFRWLDDTFNARHPQVLVQGLRMVHIFAKNRRYAEARICADRVSTSCISLYGDRLPQTLDALMVTGWENWRVCPFANFPYSSIVLRRATQLPAAKDRPSHLFIHYQLMTIEARDWSLSPPAEETLKEAEQLLQVQIHHFGRTHTGKFGIMQRVAMLYFKHGRREMGVHWLRERLKHFTILLGMTSHTKSEWLQLQSMAGIAPESVNRIQEQMRQRLGALKWMGDSLVSDQAGHLADVVELATTLCLSSHILGRDHVFTAKHEELYAQRLREGHVCDVQREIQEALDVGLVSNENPV